MSIEQIALVLEVIVMVYLEKILEDYKQSSVILNTLNDQGTKKLEVGDIVCAYGEDIAYGVIVGTVEEIYKAVLLTSELILAGSGYKIKVDHLVKTLKVTPISFYITPEMVTYFEVIKHIDQQEVEKVIKSYEKKASREYHGVWKEFYDFESQRIEIFYKKFLEYIQSKDEEEPALGDNVVYLSHFFEREELIAILRPVAAASTKKTRNDSFLVEVIDDSAVIYFSDELVGKEADIYLKDKLVFSGKLPEEIKFQIGFKVLPELLKENISLKIKH